MKMSVLLVFDTPRLQWPIAAQDHAVAYFPSTRGASSTQLPISRAHDAGPLREQIIDTAQQLVDFGQIEECSLYSYFYGISVVQLQVSISQAPTSEQDLERWDSVTDEIQRSVSENVERALGVHATAMWSTVAFISNTDDGSSSLMNSFLPELTKTLRIPGSGYIDDGLCGIGMSWVQLDGAARNEPGKPTPLEVVITTVRDAIAFCAATYSLYDRVVADYGKWLRRLNPRSRSISATRFRYVESIRVHRNLRLGPNERGLNEGLWEIWGMPAMVASLESLVDRLDNETQSATQIAIGRAQNALAISAALIVPLVSVDEIQGFLDSSKHLAQLSDLSDLQVVAATALVEGLAALAIYAIARRRRR
jgi:hypothetical protein